MSLPRPRRLAPLAVASALVLALACQLPGSRSGGDGPPLGAVDEASDPLATVSRLLVISVAGLRPWHYGGGPTGLVGGAPMPVVASLAREGAWSEAARSVTPASPYPVHATLVTGQRPAEHGVLGEEVMTDTGLRRTGTFDARRIDARTLWQSAQEAQVAVAGLAWPSTAGSRIELLLPDYEPYDADEIWFRDISSLATPWILDRIKRLDPDLEFLPNPDGPTRDRIVRELACDIADEPTIPGLWLVRFVQGEEAALEGGPGSPVARAGYGRVDREIGRLLACLEQSGRIAGTAVMVVGDRPLFPLHTRVDPNLSLQNAGLITPSPSSLGTGISGWSAFARSYGGSAVIYARNEQAALLAKRALEAAEERTRAFRVVSASELARVRADPQAWFGLEAFPGFSLGNEAVLPEVRPSGPRAVGGYLPGTGDDALGFVAWGAGIRPGVRVPEVSLLDVAPTAAMMLQLRLTGAEGRPLVGILGPTLLRGTLGEEGTAAPPVVR